MKVYAAPEEIKEPVYNYSDRNFDFQKADDEYIEKVRAWCLTLGRGKNCGDILYIPHADGKAQYMLVDGSKSFLIHLRVGDAWDSPYVEFMPKKEVVRRIEADKNFVKLFSKGGN